MLQVALNELEMLPYLSGRVVTKTWWVRRRRVCQELKCVIDGQNRATLVCGRLRAQCYSILTRLGLVANGSRLLHVSRAHPLNNLLALGDPGAMVL